MPGVGAALSPAHLPQRSVSSQSIQPRSGYIVLRCPACTSHLLAMTYNALGGVHSPVECGECSTVLAQEEGIWLALPTIRQKYFQQFMQDYETVRRAEGRGSDDPQFYLSLPYCDRSGNNSWQWEIRARTYSYIEGKILPAIKRNSAGSAAVLDLGAGNGWLSYRLAALGHRPIAVDLQTNAFDGLGAAVHYRQELPSLFPRFQAELDRLPFESGQFDCAIFNASFHYSENYSRTLAEAIRCLSPGGTIIIADSPFYTRDESGRQMLAERRQSFERQFGFKSDSIASREYLTKDVLLSLQATHGLKWTAHRVWYSLRWSCRPLVARLKNRREPALFRIYTAQVSS
jgi:SAM-dependent methyltransferase/ribosomal protein S27E